MLKETLIILLIIALIYYYRQSQKPLTFTGTDKIVSEGKELAEDLEKNLRTIRTFLQNNLNSNSLEELKTKLGEKNLDEILEENQDWETEIDTLTRTKNSLEADLLTQSNAFQSRIKEKDRENKKLKEDLSSEQKRLQKAQENLSSEKVQHKGSLERISLLTKQVGDLEKENRELKQQLKKMPGEFPPGDKK